MKLWAIVTVTAGVCSMVAAMPTQQQPRKVSSFRNPNGKYTHHHGRRGMAKRGLYTNAVNTTAAAPTINAPKENIWISLSDDEAAGVIAFLHDQPELNLTAAADATSWDNSIVVVDLIPANKTDALSYLDGTTSAPDRYAKAVVSFQACEEPFYYEYMVGPLPVSDTTTYTSASYLATKESPYIRNYGADGDAIYEKFIEIATDIQDITLDLLGGTTNGSDTDAFDMWGSDPLLHEEGRVYSWNTFWAYPTGDNAVFDGETLLPQGLFFKFDQTGRSPDGWGLVGWYYNGIYYESTEAFRAAWSSPGFEKLPPNLSGEWIGTDQEGEPSKYDSLPPPMQIQPGGQRFAVDADQKYVEWQDFSFYITFTRDTAVRLYNIKYKNQTILYELGLQEAIAHYAGQDPVQSSVAYLDTYYSFGAYAFNLVPGYDCPTYATYLNGTFHAAEVSKTHTAAMCLFETEMGYLMQRHSSSEYVSAAKNIALVLRSVSTVGNYDYTFTYTFYADGSIETMVQASGYIQSAFYANNEDYGYKIQDALSGSMHDHALTFKADFDIHGTTNTLRKESIVPVNATYPWSNTTRSTMKLERSFIENESEGKINWAPNGQSMYTIVNKNVTNDHGELPGYRIMPNVGGGMHLTIKDSPNLLNSQSFATHQLYVTKQKDTEPTVSNAWNNLDTANPIVDFSTFFDDESIDQEDIVLWFNLGMHHVPQTQDLPNTVMTSAQASMIFSPVNYFEHNPYKATSQQVRIDFTSEEGVTDIHEFGKQMASGTVSLEDIGFDFYSYTGDIAVRKFPYDPQNPYNDTHAIV